MKLSERIRPDVEAAPWVIDEVKRLESELADAYLEMAKIRLAIKAVFDRDVWDRVEVSMKGCNEPTLNNAMVEMECVKLDGFRFIEVQQWAQDAARKMLSYQPKGAGFAGQR